MIKAEIYNKIPKDSSLYADIKKEKHFIVYKLASIRREDTPGNKRKEIIPHSENIPSHDIVVDPNTGESYPIGVFKRIHADGGGVLAQIELGLHNAGRIMIDPKTKNASQINLYKFLEATDYNGSKEGRDTSKEIRFFRVRIEEEAKKRTADQKKIIEIKKSVFDLSLDQAKAIALALEVSKPNEMTEEMLQDAILKKVDEVPDKVKGYIEDVNVDIVATLKEAKDFDVIGHDKKEGVFTYAGEQIFQYKPGVGISPYDELAAFVAKEKADVLVAIRQQIKQKKS